MIRAPPPPANPAARVALETRQSDGHLAQAPRAALPRVARGRRPREDRRGPNPRRRARRRGAGAGIDRRDRQTPPAGKILMRTPWEIPALALAAVVAACSGAAPASLCPEPKAYTADEDSRAAREPLSRAQGLHRRRGFPRRQRAPHLAQGVRARRDDPRLRPRARGITSVPARAARIGAWPSVRLTTYRSRGDRKVENFLHAREPAPRLTAPAAARPSEAR